jgi:hypothetical protein
MFYKDKLHDVGRLWHLFRFLLRTGYAYALPDAPAERARLSASLPLQVFSCWNGAAAFDADAFAAPDGIRFRMAHADLDEEGRPLPFSDMTSESFLSSVDMWKRGRGRIMVVPKARCVCWYAGPR